MPTKVQRLMTQARLAAASRGHILGAFQKHLRSPKNMVGTATCSVCGREVQFIERPAANEIDIGGEALALNCTPFAGTVTGRITTKTSNIREAERESPNPPADKTFVNADFSEVERQTAEKLGGSAIDRFYGGEEVVDAGAPKADTPPVGDPDDKP